MLLQCLALGADAVMLGRPLLYGLALGGQQGAESVLSMLRHELQLTMALMGTPRLTDIHKGMLQTKNVCPRCRL